MGDLTEKSILTPCVRLYLRIIHTVHARGRGARGCGHRARLTIPRLFYCRICDVRVFLRVCLRSYH